MNTIDITQVNPFALPSVPLEELNRLPEASGIYFAIAGGEVLYVGKATCIYLRWQGHHKAKDLEPYDKVRIAWFTYATSGDEELREIEKAFISYFKPSLNQVGVPREDVISMHKQTILISEDLAFRLKVHAAKRKETIASITTRALEKLLAEEENS